MPPRSVIPDGWSDFYRDTHIPAATVIGDRVHVAGHTGARRDGTFPVDPEDQIRQTFLNIAETLVAAGAGWEDVVELTSYHVGLRLQGEVFLTVAAEFLHRPFPAWTAVGVVELFEPEAVIEISCTASLPG